MPHRQLRPSAPPDEPVIRPVAAGLRRQDRPPTSKALLINGLGNERCEVPAVMLIAVAGRSVELGERASTQADGLVGSPQACATLLRSCGSGVVCLTVQLSSCATCTPRTGKPGGAQRAQVSGTRLSSRLEPLAGNWTTCWTIRPQLTRGRGQPIGQLRLSRWLCEQASGTPSTKSHRRADLHDWPQCRVSRQPVHDLVTRGSDRVTPSYNIVARDDLSIGCAQMP